MKWVYDSLFESMPKILKPYVIFGGIFDSNEI